VNAVRSIAKVALGVEAALALTIASIALRLLPKGRASRLLGRAGRVESVEIGVADARARRVGRAVERVAAVLPWRPACLPQAIATRAMLRRRGVPCEGHLGVRSAAPLEAHAWVTVNGRVVQGGPVGSATKLAVFR
jgi:hypothetical protein